tara:strand:+ start:2504 stop:3175 length:672 start_codon:yes stop_codon:yes gene_type:complete
MEKIFSLVQFISQPKNNFFSPQWHYYICETEFDNVDYKKLAKFLLKKEKTILKLKPTIKENKISDGYTGLGKNSTTARYDRYNVLNWKNIEIVKLKNNIIKTHNCLLKTLNVPLPTELYIQCWYNVLKKTQYIRPHIHGVSPDTYLGGHICIQVKDTSTYYINPINQINDPEIYKSQNKVGKLTLFQNCIPHYTDVHKDKKERITIAFDLSLKKINENYIKLI